MASAWGGATMECILFRHGIAIESNEWEGTEENRPLTDKGKKRTRQAAQGLTMLGCRLTHLFTSPFVRAYDTARLVRTAVCPTLKLETREELAVGTKPEQLVAFLRTFPSNAVVLCVGHEPLLGEVASLLLCGKVLSNLPLKKAGAASLELMNGVKPGQARLRWWLQPGQLRAIGKHASSKEAD
jgi:phosphohistidine phosphatase